ncbi:MAG TPA: cytochrome c oxidase assembly factor 1 family protein [Chthoniobacterales bacterium]|jgi:hypothetical protein
MDPQTPPSVPPPPRRNWWQRNWKWFVPSGCLVILLACAAFVFIIIGLLFGVLKSSDAYKTALARARSDPRVTSSLGSPIEPGFLISGNANVNGASGQADLSIPISGPKGKGTIYVVATKQAGEWTYTKLIVEVDKDHQRIDLSKQ